VTPHNNLLCHRTSAHLHCTNRIFTYVLRKNMSTLSRRSKRILFRRKVLNEISRKSKLNHTTWLKFCNWSFTIVTPTNCSVISWATALCLIRDWYPHDYKHFATNCYTSALYGNCKGVRLRWILTVVTNIFVDLVSVTSWQIIQWDSDTAHSGKSHTFYTVWKEAWVKL